MFLFFNIFNHGGAAWRGILSRDMQRPVRIRNKQVKHPLGYENLDQSY